MFFWRFTAVAVVLSIFVISIESCREPDDCKSVSDKTDLIDMDSATANKYNNSRIAL